MNNYSFGEIDPDIIDTLYELSNVGVGMASTVLSKILGISITIGIPKIMSVKSDFENVIGENPEKLAVGIFMTLEKTLGGAVLFIFESEFLSEIVWRLTGKEVSGNELVDDEDSLSAVQEAVNIMAAAYMKAIGKYTGIRIYLSPVMVGVDMIGALVTYPMAQLDMSDNSAVCVDTSFSIVGKNDKNMLGRVIMFPNKESIELIVDALYK